MFSKLIDKFKSLRYYVIADPADNSITLSKRLFNHIRRNAQAGDVPSVFVFKIPAGATFGFMINPDIKQPTQLCQIQYNDKYSCIGFETLCPSVGQIFYEYGLAPHQTVKLSVSVRKTTQGKIYYQINKPTIKLINKWKAFSETHAKQI